MPLDISSVADNLSATFVRGQHTARAKTLIISMISLFRIIMIIIIIIFFIIKNLHYSPVHRIPPHCLPAYHILAEWNNFYVCSAKESRYRSKAGPDGTVACRALRVGEVDDREQAKPSIIKIHLLAMTAALNVVMHHCWPNRQLFSLYWAQCHSIIRVDITSSQCFITATQGSQRQQTNKTI